MGHPDVLQLSETVQEALWKSVNGVGLQVELVQMFREFLWDLGSVNENIVGGLKIIIHLMRH